MGLERRGAERRISDRSPKDLLGLLLAERFVGREEAYEICFRVCFRVALNDEFVEIFPMDHREPSQHRRCVERNLFELGVGIQVGDHQAVEELL